MRRDIKFDKRASKYDKGFEGKLSNRFYEDLIQNITVSDHDKILDVGCGTGTILYRISQNRLVEGYGLDISNDMIREAKEKCPQMNFQIGSCEILPFEDKSLDIVVACMAYHHFPSQEKFREETFRVLREGGKVYICDPLFPKLIRKLLNSLFKVSGRNAYFYSSEQINSAFLMSGFAMKKRINDSYVQVFEFNK